VDSILIGGGGWRWLRFSGGFIRSYGRR
jgi:hypothetical protein